MNTILGMFVKQPVPGTVKTRLAAGVGPETAAEVYAAFVADQIGIHGQAADACVLGFAPNSEPARQWAEQVAGSHFDVWLQPEGNLGTRIHAFFQHAFAQGAERVVLVGSDSPNLPPAYVQNAFAALEQTDVVIGPASDGGYYLIGQRTTARDLFVETDWSSSRVFEQTSNQVRRQSASLAVLPVWYDIDTIDDARMLWAHLAAAGHQQDDLARTQALLDRLFESGPAVDSPEAS